MCELYGLSENELFTNYDFFKKTLYNTVGKGEANAILISIKKELLAQAILNGSNLTVREIINPKFTINDILKKVNDSEVLKFITNIPPTNIFCFFMPMQVLRFIFFLPFFTQVKLF